MKARALKKNDKVGLVAPGARPESAATVAFASRVIEEMGFIPVVGKNVLKVHGHFAGTDRERLEDLNGFIRDESIKAIFCVTEGFGSLPLLPGVDYDAIKVQRKLIVGSDENTPLLTAVNLRTSLPVVLGPNLDRVTSRASFESLRDAVSSTSPVTIHCVQEKLTDKLSLTRSYSSFVGQASGTVIGGSLSGVVSLMGTPFQPRFENALLYLEDYNERYDILDRWFTTLYVSGMLVKTAGVLFGEFTGCGARGNTSVLPVEDLFGERLHQLRKPNLFALPLGHNGSSQSIPMGVSARFDTARSTLEFAESAVD